MTRFQPPTFWAGDDIPVEGGVIRITSAQRIFNTYGVSGLGSTWDSDVPAHEEITGTFMFIPGPSDEATDWKKKYEDMQDWAVQLSIELENIKAHYRSQQ